MKSKNRPFKKFLNEQIQNDKRNNVKVKFGLLLKECCKDYEETDDSGKLLILQKVIMMILTLMDSDQYFEVSVNPVNLSE